MAIPKITSDYVYMSDPGLLLKANTILTSMTGNTNFDTPIPSLASVSGTIEDYSTALVAAQMRDKTKVAAKNEKRLELVETLRALGNYVTQVAEGDEATLVSSGFTLAKSGQPSPPIGNPQDLRVENGLNPGEIETSVKAVKGARSYIHQYTADPITDNSQWTSEATTRRKNVFAGLEPAKTYWFRVAAIGANEQIAYSDILSKIVQ
jgi:hypothetical protein